MKADDSSSPLQGGQPIYRSPLYRFAIEGDHANRRRWRIAAATVILSWILILGIFWETAASMAATWHRSKTFAHGFLILPISFHLAWARRRQIASLIPAPNLWALPLLIMLGLGWLLGKVVDLIVLQQLALVAMLQTLVWTVLGTEVARTLLFPLIFLFFAVPMGEALVPPLQSFTALFTLKALDLSGIPAYLEGRLISIPSGNWEIAEACSGARYVIPAAALGSLYARLMYRSWLRRLGFMLAALAVPILANGLRAYGIIMLAHLTDNRIAVGIDHLVYSWIFFAAVVLPLFWLGLRWREPGPIHQPAHSSLAIDSGPNRAPLHATPLAALGSIALLALAPIAAGFMSKPPTTPPIIGAAAPPANLPWRALPRYFGGWEPRFIGADARMAQSYTAGRRQVHLHIAYYASQRPGAELINSENVIADGMRWIWLAEGEGRALVDGRELKVRQIAMRSARGSLRLVWSWYWVGGEFTANPYRAKLLQAKALLLGRAQGAAAIVLGADYDLHHAEAAATLQDFLRHTSLRATLEQLSSTSGDGTSFIPRQATPRLPTSLPDGAAAQHHRAVVGIGDLLVLLHP